MVVFFPIGGRERERETVGASMVGGFPLMAVCSSGNRERGKREMGESQIPCLDFSGLRW